MSQSFNIAASGPTSGLDALLGGTSSAKNAPEGLFSSLVSLMGSTNGPKISDLVQAGTPNNSGKAWLNLQMGDASLSLSSEALTTAMSEEQLLAKVPGILDDLGLDDAVLQGLSNLGGSVREAIGQVGTSQASTSQASTSQASTLAQSNTPIAQIANAVLNMQEAAQNLGAQTTTTTTAAPPQPIAEANVLPGASPQSIANAATETPKAVLGQQAGAGTPLTLEQVASRDSLAAQLQRQMTSNAEQQQARIAATTEQNASQQTPTSNASPNAQANAASQNPTGFAAALSQLPFVQTRQVQPLNDPLMVAQNAGSAVGQTAAQAEQSTLFQPVKAAYQSPQVNLPHMAVAIARNFNAGKNNFQIRLDPAELGRVNIQLSMDDAGTINAKMLVERPETLQLLQQDARALERALSQAGLDGARASLEFSLKDNPFSGDAFGNPDEADNPENENNNGQHQPDSGPDTAIAAYQGAIRPGGVSLWI